MIKRFVIVAALAAGIAGIAMNVQARTCYTNCSGSYGNSYCTTTCY